MIQRLWAMGGVALLHLLVYFVVTRLTLLRPASAFVDFHLGLDDEIPHLAWSWPAYWQVASYHTVDVKED